MNKHLRINFLIIATMLIVSQSFGQRQMSNSANDEIINLTSASQIDYDYYKPNEVYQNSSERTSTRAKFVNNSRTSYPLGERYTPSIGLILQLPLTTTRQKSTRLYVENDKNQTEFFGIEPLKSVNGMMKSYQLTEKVLNHIRLSAPNQIVYTAEELEKRRICFTTIGANGTLINSAIQTPSIDSVTNNSKVKNFKLDKKYWFPSFESSTQFAQNYISPNWHKGGSSNLNLISRQLFRYDYKSDELNWNNELEWRLGIFTRTEDSIRKYRFNEDLLRLRTNFGLKAFQNWFYTIDVEARTQLFSTYSEDNTVLYSSLFSPITLTAGLGMKWVIDKKYTSPFGKHFQMTVNIAPIAYDFKWAMRDDIDLARHGFGPGKRIYSALGTMVRANMSFALNQSITWKSMLYYNTSYKRVESEFENSLIFSINKYLTSQINLHLRYDDATPILPGAKTRLQINELISIGFQYKI